MMSNIQCGHINQVTKLPKLTYCLPEIDDDESKINLKSDLMIELYGEENLFSDNQINNINNDLNEFTGDFEDFKSVQPILNFSTLTEDSLPTLDDCSDVKPNNDKSDILDDEKMRIIEEILNDDSFFSPDYISKESNLNLFNASIFSTDINEENELIYSFDPPEIQIGHINEEYSLNLPPIYDNKDIWEDYRQILYELETDAPVIPESSVSEMAFFTQHSINYAYKKQGNIIFENDEEFKKLLVECQTKQSINILIKGEYIVENDENNLEILFNTNRKYTQEEKDELLSISNKLSELKENNEFSDNSHSTNDEHKTFVKTINKKIKQFILMLKNKFKIKKINKDVDSLLKREKEIKESISMTPENYLIFKLNDLYEMRPDRLKVIKEYLQTKVQQENSEMLNDNQETLIEEQIQLNIKKKELT